MQNGKWVPVSKYFADSLPRTRKFTELEAIYSLQLDLDGDKSVTVSGCASRWGWSRSKVSKFFKDNEIIIIYDEDTKKTKNQRGKLDICQEEKRHIKRHKKSNKKTIKEHKRLIDSSWITEQKDIKRAMKEHKKSNEKSTTTNNLLIPNPESEKDLSDKVRMIVDYLNKKLGTKYTYKADKTIKPIRARLKEGHNGKEFKIVIDKKYGDWYGTEDAKYLRPETLFGGKFEGYLNQLDNSGQQQDDGKSEAQAEYEATQAIINQ